MLTTGGTVASKKVGSFLDVKLSGEDLVREFPELSKITNLEVEEFMQILSENMIPSDWQKIAERTKPYLESDDIDGIVITHGTDTMSYTAGALPLMLQNPGKPVIITGSMTSIEKDKVHVKRHIVDSILAAAHSGIAEFMICFSGDSISRFTYLFRASRARKAKFPDYDAFHSPRSTPIATIHNKRIKILDNYVKPNGRNLKYNPYIDTAVGSVKLYPGINLSGFLSSHKKLGTRGIVIEGYSSGSLIISKNSEKALSKYLENDGFGCVVAQDFSDAKLESFEQDRRLREAGLIPLGDMIFEKAIPKLMWGMAQTKDPSRLKRIMQHNYAGEITPGSYRS